MRYFYIFYTIAFLGLSWFAFTIRLDLAIAESDIYYYRMEMDRQARVIVKLEHRLYYERKLASEYRAVAGAFGVGESNSEQE